MGEFLSEDVFLEELLDSILDYRHTKDLVDIWSLAGTFLKAKLYDILKCGRILLR